MFENQKYPYSVEYITKEATLSAISINDVIERSLNYKGTQPGPKRSFVIVNISYATKIPDYFLNKFQKVFEKDPKSICIRGGIARQDVVFRRLLRLLQADYDDIVSNKEESEKFIVLTSDTKKASVSFPSDPMNPDEAYDKIKSQFNKRRYKK